MQKNFAVYMPDEAFLATKPLDEIDFVGKSVPHFQLIQTKVRNQLPDYAHLPPRQVDFEAYTSVHSPTYIEIIQQLAQGNPDVKYPNWSIECRGMEFMIPGLSYTLGGHYAAIDMAREGKLDRAYILGAPGGHHAFRDKGHGYCIVHPVAAGVRYAQTLGFKRIVIADYDFHHGDGTQEIFAHDPNVYCISSHSAFDIYMAKASNAYLGTTEAAEAVGHCNIPLLWQSLDDVFWQESNLLAGHYYRAADSIPMWRQVMQNLPFVPDLIYVFSGYDGHIDDCGKGITDWDNDDFVELTEIILRAAHEANCPVISYHGGGYKVPITVSATLAHLDAMAHL